MFKMIKKFLSKSPRITEWTSIEHSPSEGKRVLIRSKDKGVNIGHLCKGKTISDSDKEPEKDYFVAFTFSVNEKEFKFIILEPVEWRDIPE